MTEFRGVRGEVVQRRPEDLKPHPRNSRTHTEEQVAQIAASIRRFGFNAPVLAAGDTIVAGHARVQAALSLEMDTVPVVDVSHMSESEIRAYIIADNQHALNAGWEEDVLAVELMDLAEEGFDPFEMGFDGTEEFFAERTQGQTDPDDVPPVPAKAVSREGDLWLLGEHRVLCGDATVLSDVERVLDGGLADMVFCDPPYNVDYGNSAKDKLRGKNRRIRNDNLGDAFAAFLYDACVNILTVTKGAVYVCMSSSELHTLQGAFKDAGGHWSTFVIWAKNTFTLGRADYQRQYESILYGWKEGTDHYWCGARDQGDVWFVNKPVRNDLHPTMKPVELVERAIRNSSKSRDIVLDPFGGSGSTLIACEQAGRQARLIELDPLYVDVVVRRWQEFTGREARLASTDQTFAEVEEERS